MSMAKQKPVIIYENTVSGTFVRRLNRFTAEVLIDGQTEIVHIKNTGRLQELLVPKAKVTMQKTSNPNRKTEYDLISVYKPKLKWVNIDSLAPNALMKQELMSRNYDLVKPEYNYRRIQNRFLHGTRWGKIPDGSKRLHTGRSSASGYWTVPGCTDRAWRKAFV